MKKRLIIISLVVCLLLIPALLLLSTGVKAERIDSIAWNTVNKGLLYVQGKFAITTKGTFTEADETPNVMESSLWDTGTTTVTIAAFADTNVQDGQIIFVRSRGATTYDVTSSSLLGGSTDLVTADTDLTVWQYDATSEKWILVSFTDQSDDNS